MNIEMMPLISFALITTFTPGPNNISSASMGVMLGYRRTFHYMLGITSGFFVIMIACAYLSSALLSVLPVAERYLRWVGALYILWLAAGILRAQYAFSETDETPHAFTKGFVLQLFNPKVAVYGLTLYSTFLAAVSGRPAVLAAFAAVFALTAFASISMWALCGAAIKARLRKDRFRKIVNAFLSLLLVYTAFELADIAALL